MYKGFAVCSETVKTDKRLTTFAPEISCTAARISCTAARISCRNNKFSREFQSYTADTQKHLTYKQVVPDVPFLDSKTSVTPNALYY